MQAFKSAVEARDLGAMAATMNEDVVFRSPVAHKTYLGRDRTMTLLANVTEVFEEFTYLYAIGADGDKHQGLVFTAKVGDRVVTGCDFITLGDNGLIDELMVMIRPLSALVALAEAMGQRPEVLGVNDSSKK